MSNVRRFLELFRDKLIERKIMFRNNGEEGILGLNDLEIMPEQRYEILQGIDEDDYKVGPIDDAYQASEGTWIFSKDVKEKETNIKITLGISEDQMALISFHQAEFAINYSLKSAV